MAVRSPWFLTSLGVALVVGLAVSAWLAPERFWRGQPPGGEPAAATGHDHGHDHDTAHAHDHSGAVVELSRQARANIGLKTAPLARQAFTRSITVPAMIVEPQGCSDIVVTATFGGVVERIRILAGEAVTPGQTLFDFRVTHEELVHAQTDFLKTIEELDVVAREIARLEPLEQGGAIAAKVVLDRRYERQRLEGLRRAQRQGLLLLGLVDPQVDAIERDRRLIQELSAVVPEPHPGDEHRIHHVGPLVMQVHEILVSRGQAVSAGERLAVLSEHAELYIEGLAFEQDAESLFRALEKNWTTTAILDLGSEPLSIESLPILYVADQVDPQARTLKFYVRLPNQLARDSQTTDGRRFISWRYRPGQRLQLQVPIERWDKRWVVPVAAIVQEGPESYVFLEEDGHFHRQPVRIVHRDPWRVVLDDDEQLHEGDTLVVTGAQPLQWALKQQASGGIDPHAGHHH